MDLLQALILGLVQGLTEFFPISSSAHLRFAKQALGVADGEHLLFFDLVCHAGTLLALIFYLRRDILGVLRAPRKMALYAAALLPLVPAYFLLKPLRLAASDPSYLGLFLILTSTLLFAATRKKQPQRSCDPWLQPGTEKSKRDVGGPLKAELLGEDDERSDGARHCLKSKASDEDRFFKAGCSPNLSSQRSCDPLKWRDVLCIGGMQALALVPGVSRSGSTMAAARFCGWEWKDAARFSFLLAVPAVLGGQLLETLKLLKGSSEAVGAVNGECYAAGFAASFGLGLLAVRLAFQIYERGKVRPFAWYCLGAGLVALKFFHG